MKAKAIDNLINTFDGTTVEHLPSLFKCLPDSNMSPSKQKLKSERKDTLKTLQTVVDERLQSDHRGNLMPCNSLAQKYTVPKKNNLLRMNGK